VQNTPVLVRQQVAQLRKLVAAGASKVERAENRGQAMARAGKQAREKREEREREREGNGGAACHTRTAQCSEVQ